MFFMKDKDKIARLVKEYGHLLIPIIGIVNVLVCRCITFKFKCDFEEYYKVDRQYFDGSQIIESHMMFVLLAGFFVAYTLLFCVANKFAYDNVMKTMIFIACFCILVYQSLTYSEYIMLYSKYQLLSRMSGNVITLLVLIAADFFVARILIWTDKVFNNKIITIISIIAIIIVIINIVCGFCTGVAFGVEDKKKYQILDEGEYKQVVISTYDGMFVTMDCEIRGNGTGLYIDNSKYRLVDMAERDIEYRKFDIVETRYE